MDLETSWWVEALALILPSSRKLRTSRSEDSLHENHISNFSGDEVAIVISVLLIHWQRGGGGYFEIVLL